MKLTLIQSFGRIFDVNIGDLYKHLTRYFASEPKKRYKVAVLRGKIEGSYRF